MTFDPRFLNQTARSVPARRDRPTYFTVEVVHPGIIMVQKSSDAFGRPPREKDIADVAAIAAYWKEQEGYTHSWDPIVSTAIDALPPKQVDVTIGRLQAALT